MAAGAPPDRAGEAESSAFYRLDERIQRWIWAEGWEELRDIQERAIPLVLAAERDIILAAATASVTVRSGPSFPVESLSPTMVSTTNGSGHHEA